MLNINKIIQDVSNVCGHSEYNLSKIIYDNDFYGEYQNPISEMIEKKFNVKTFFKTPKVICSTNSGEECYVPNFMSKYYNRWLTQKEFSSCIYKDIKSLLLSIETCGHATENGIALNLAKYSFLAKNKANQNPIKTLCSEKLNMDVEIDEGYLLHNKSAIKLGMKTIEFNKKFNSGEFSLLFNAGIPTLKYCEHFTKSNDLLSTIDIFKILYRDNQQYVNLISKNNFVFFRDFKETTYSILKKFTRDSFFIIYCKKE